MVFVFYRNFVAKILTMDKSEVRKKIDEKVLKDGSKLPLVENFYTIQGEGYHTGKPAYFIRIGGCDIGCHFCDTKMSWDPSIHPLVDLKTIVANAMKTPAHAIVVTGGEPTNYNLGPLSCMLREHGIKLFLETAGTESLTGEWDWICLSPKRQSPPLEEFYDRADELKVIIMDDEDFPWAEETASKMGDNTKLFLQSEWSRYEENISKIVDYVKNNPKWSISLQAHKFMHIP